MVNNPFESKAYESYDSHQGKYLTPFQRKVLLKNLQADLRPEYICRIKIMLLADQGQSQSKICEELGCSQETARYWIAVAQAGLAHQWNERPMGRPKTVNQQYLQRLEELVSHSPRDYGYPFQSWTAHWLSKHLATEFGIEFSDRHVNRLLKQMGLSTKKPDRAKKVVDRPQDSNIVIGDLQSTSSPNLLWQFNLLHISN